MCICLLLWVGSQIIPKEDKDVHHVFSVFFFRYQGIDRVTISPTPSSRQLVRKGSRNHKIASTCGSGRGDAADGLGHGSCAAGQATILHLGPDSLGKIQSLTGWWFQIFFHLHPDPWGIDFTEHFSNGVETKQTWWWFQIFYMFIPTWGRFPIWLIFSKWVETTI